MSDTSEKLTSSRYDTADHLRDDEEARLFLMACVDEAGDDAAYIAAALGAIVRSRAAMAGIAEKSGLSRESLYKGLSGKRDPAFSTVLKVASALGLRLKFEFQEKKPLEAIGNAVGTATASEGVPVSFSISSIGVGQLREVGQSTSLTRTKLVSSFEMGLPLGRTGTPAKGVENAKFVRFDDLSTRTLSKGGTTFPSAQIPLTQN